MGTLLFQAVSGLAALICLFAWLKPARFRYLLDKDSPEPSLGRVGQFTALITSTWAFVALVLSDKLNEWFFTAYMLSWAGAQFGSLWLKQRGQQGGAPP